MLWVNAVDFDHNKLWLPNCFYVILKSRGSHSRCKSISSSCGSNIIRSSSSSRHGIRVYCSQRSQFDKSQRFMTRAATVCCGQKPKHFTCHREAICIQGLAQLVVARDYNLFPCLKYTIVSKNAILVHHKQYFIHKKYYIQMNSILVWVYGS